MKELVKLNETQFGEELIRTVNARELHEFLEVKSKYYDWITKRIGDYDFQEGVDFICLTEKKVTQTSDGRQGSANISVHHISLDMAKELAMVERNEKGKEARQYFIQCEKQLKTMSGKDNYLLSIMRAGSELDRAVAINQYELGYVRPLEMKVEEQAKTIEEQAPKVTYHDMVLANKELLTISQIAQDYPISNRQLNKILADKGVQYKDKGMWCLYSKYSRQGLAQTTTYVHENEIKLYLKWTQKGRLFIYKLLKKEGISPNCEVL